MNISLYRKYSLLLSSAFLLLTLGIILSWFNPVGGYDISIYSSTPFVYWMALVVGIIVSFLIISAKVCGKEIPKYLMLATYVLLAFCMISLTYLLTIRGYYGYNFNGDTGTHIGNILEGLASGTLESLYPNIYIHTMFLHNLSGLDVIYLTKVTPPLFILLFIMGIYLLSREIFPKKNMAVLSAFTACALPFGVVSDYTGSLPLACYLPYTPALLFFSVFCLYVVYRIVNTQSSNKAFLVLGILLFVSVLFYHILACAVLLLFVDVLCGWIIFKRGLYQNVVPVVTSLLTIVGTTVVVWVFWISHMQYLRIPVKSLYSALFEDDTGTVYSNQMIDLAGTAFGMDLVDILDVLIKQFGSTGLILLMIACALPIVYFGIRRRQEFLNVVPFYIVIVPILGVAGVSLISWLSFQPGRMVMFVTIVGVLLSGVVLYTLLQYVVKGEKKLWRVVSVLMLIGILVPLFVLGLQMYYPGIEVHSAGGMSGNTHAQSEAMDFYFVNGNLDYSYLGLGYQPLVYRYSNLLYWGEYVPNLLSQIYVRDISEGIITYHFGYDENCELGDSMSETSYLLMNAKSLSFNRNYGLWQKYRHYWYESEYEHLEYDSSVKRIMDNGDEKWYLIYS